MIMSDAESTAQGLVVRSIARTGCVVALWGVLLLSASCAVERRAEAPVLPAPLTKKIPLRIGVHYSLEFRLARPISDGFLWKIGEPSTRLFRTVLPMLFDDVVEVEHWPPGGKDPMVAGVIVPTVLGAGSDSGGIAVQYQIELFSRHGDRIGNWVVEGRWDRRPSFSAEYAPAEISHAIRTAGAALIASFFREPQARAWLAANGISPESLQ